MQFQFVAPMTLLQAPFRKPVVVEEVSGDRAFRRRIMEMGLVPGTEVRVLAVAPLGDPLTLELRSSLLSIRKREAAQVRVRA
jgi:Fe2+ transport system protein FeoA